jgi:hypothetical protein
MARHLRFIITMFALLTTTTVWAQPPTSVPRPSLDDGTKHTETSPKAVAIGFSLGVGQYPILSMPMMGNSDMRVDGSTHAEDFRVNRGSSFNLELKWQKSDSRYPINISGAWNRLATSPSAGIATPSSYSRLDLELGSKVSFEDQGLSLSPAIGARRSMYQNVDSGHYIDAVILRAMLAYQLSEKLELSAAYGIAPLTKFGIMQATNQSSSGGLQDARARLTEWTATLSYRVSQHSKFLCSASEENAKVEMDNYEGYLAYGLPVATPEPGQTKKNYSLRVRQLTFGAVTFF